MTAINERTLFPAMEGESLTTIALSRTQTVLCDRHEALCAALKEKRAAGMSVWEPEFVELSREQQRYDTACQVVYAEIERCWIERAAREDELERLHQHEASLRDWADAHGEDTFAARRDQELADMQWADDGGPA